MADLHFGTGQELAPRDPCVILVDDAQQTYNHGGFWEYIKSIRTQNITEPRRVILFAGYGSAVSAYGTTPPYIGPQCRITLKAIELADRFPAVGLLFTLDEVKDWVEKTYGQSFGDDCIKAMFKLSMGHIGAIEALFSVIVTLDVRICCVSSLDLYVIPSPSCIALREQVVD